MKTPSLHLLDVRAARRSLAGGVRLTPCHAAPPIAEIAGTRVWLKREDLQRTGSFKERGARHALSTLSPHERAAGVVAASAGNHALGLAYHGGLLGIKVTVVMPVTAPQVKVDRCRGLGAEVVLHGPTFDAADGFARELAARVGANYVHPFDDLRVIAGQGTLAWEILEQTPELDTLVVPVGGGGLLAGVAVTVKALRPDVRVVGVEPDHAAGFLAACLRGEPGTTALLPTLADGLAVAQVGRNTFAAAAPLIDDLVTVTEAELARGMAVLARGCGIVAEGAGAAAVAALVAGKVRGRACVLPITGRNVDPVLHAQVVAQRGQPGSAALAVEARAA